MPIVGGGGGSSSPVIFNARGLASLVSETPEADADANAAVSWGAIPDVPYREGFVFTTPGGGSGPATTTSWWRLAFQMPGTKRFTLRGFLGPRNTTVQPLVSFFYQGVTRAAFLHRGSGAAGNVSIRNNAVTYDAAGSPPTIGINTNPGGEFSVDVCFSDGDATTLPVADFSIHTAATAASNTFRGSYPGTATLNAAWQNTDPITVAIGVGQLTGGASTTHVSGIQIQRHWLDL